ncbi:MAG: hypothetical protein KGH76_03780 [Thaumarchaeota archaeon]|nr:hypothetical protein [Nitrososphaerota archaeon]MDE1842366.1 hypothetical protein [Nitrososphaerota archaeon]
MYKIVGIFLALVLIAGLTGVAFAEYNDNSSSARESSHDKGPSNDNSIDDSQNYTKSDDQNKTGEESQSEYKSLNENNHDSNEEDHQADQEENKTSHENQDQEEINNENNNEKATHQEDQQTRNDLGDAIENKTVSTIVNIGEHSQETKSIDDNIDAHTDNSTNDSVSVTVDSKTESGPKVIVFNLNSTTIDVSSIKYLHITYDGQSISPAADINSVLHAKSTDNPSYAIIVTQNGAQVLVSIPHFSNHTITLSSISKAMSLVPPVPEFPLAVPVLLAGTISVIIFYRMKFIK